MFLPLILAGSNCTIQNFAVGDFNITSEQHFKEIMKQEEIFLLGISAKWCAHCCQIENIYAEVFEALEKHTPKIKFVRIDMSKLNFIKKHIPGNDQLPLLYVIKKGKFYRYEDLMNVENIVSFLDKLYMPVSNINSETELEAFFEAPNENKNYLRVLGIFYENDDSEDSPLNEYEKTAISLANWIGSKMGILTNKALIKELKSKGNDIVRCYNCLVLKKKDADLKVLDLEISQNIKKWISTTGVGIVEELSGYNFQIYKEIALPMLVMFLDKHNVNQDYYINILTKVARDFDEDIKFVWMDGTDPMIKQRKKKLGLVTEILPSMAFNVLDDRILPYKEGKSITESTIRLFVSDFIENRLSSKNVAEIRSNPELESKYSDTPIVTMNEFEEKVLSEGTDVLLLLYSSYQNEDSLNLAPYFNKVAKRFKELNYPHLKVYRMDTATQTVHKNVKIDHVPVIYLLPAYHKNPPYVQYTNEAKVPPMMFFVEKYADIKFTLPELPHLSPDQIGPYWEQKAELSPEKQERVAAHNERRNWDL